jgi:predicted transcriptional regulator
MKTITIRVSDQLEAELEKASRDLGTSRSDVMREALQNHLRLQKFKSIRKSVMPLAESRGYLTDEDIFNDPDFS